MAHATSAAIPVPVELGTVENGAVLNGKGDLDVRRAASRAQAESARASGATAVHKPTVARDCNVQCEVGDEADRSGGTLAIVAGSGGRVGLTRAGVATANGKDDHGGSLLIADLPRPPEPGDVLKGVAQHEPGTTDGHVADVVGGGSGASRLLPADLPRPPEIGWLGRKGSLTAHLSDEEWVAWMEGLGVDISGLKALHLAPLGDDEGAKVLGSSHSTAVRSSHCGGKHGKKGKRT